MSAFMKGAFIAAGFAAMLAASTTFAQEQPKTPTMFVALAADDPLFGNNDYGLISASEWNAEGRGHSNRLTMLWYFSMYQRFSLLYRGIDTGRVTAPSAFQTQGHFTAEPVTSACARLSWSS